MVQRDLMKIVDEEEDKVSEKEEWQLREEL